MKQVKKYLRPIIQALFFLYTLGIGARFYLFLRGIEAGDLTVSRPPGVEGFLPISALIALKQLVFGQGFDMIHPAGLTILLAALIMSILLKKSFCSHICPVGFVSEMISKAGAGFRIHPYIPVWLLKYVLLGFFLYISFSMPLVAAKGFLQSPYNMIVDSRMLDFFLKASVTTVIVTASIILLTLVFKGLWCKYLCPYGALMGLCSFLSPTKIARDESKCIDCKKCSQACPMSLKVHMKKTVLNADCIGCHECIKVCPSDCLNTKGMKWRWFTPLFAPAIFLLFVAVAMISGHWVSEIPNEVYQSLLKMNIGHP
jgi:polyferredoxin